MIWIGVIVAIVIAVRVYSLNRPRKFDNTRLVQRLRRESIEKSAHFEGPHWNWDAIKEQAKK